MASDYTDGLALQAIDMVFEYLPRSFEEADPLAREKMHNASCIAGMAFTNAFLGLNHSMAHKLGGEYHIPHGRANAVLLPYVIAYNASKPTKFAAFPKYGPFVADQKYAKAARTIGVGGATRKRASPSDRLRACPHETPRVPLSIRSAVWTRQYSSQTGDPVRNAHSDHAPVPIPVSADQRNHGSVFRGIHGEEPVVR
jgi:alcohol dehydrogenase class IV